MVKKITKSSQNGTNTSLSSLSTTTTTTGGAIPSILTDGLPLPRAIVFDLDYTLWPFWIDTHVSPPLKPNNTHSAGLDRNGESFSFFTDVPAILHALQICGVKIGIASRTSAPDLARELLKMLYVPGSSAVLGEGGLQKLSENISSSSGEPQPHGILGNPQLSSVLKQKEKTRKALDFFDNSMMEIYPGSKIRHFETLAKRTGIAHTDMLFFDDESRNKETESLGVTMWLVRDGVTWNEIVNGITEWRRRRGIRE